MPAPALVARLGMNARGFMAGLKESEGAFKEFGKGLPKVIGDAAVGTVVAKGVEHWFDKFFHTGKNRDQTRVIVERVTGIDPGDPGHFRAKLGIALGILATAGTAAAVGGAKLAGQIKDESEQADITTTSVQKLTGAAKESGLEFNNFASGLDNLGNARKDAIESNEEMRKKFKEYGVTLRDLLDPQKSNLDLMRQMAAAVKGLTLSPSQRNDFRDLFGKGGEKLIAGLNNLDHQTGSIIPEADINALDKAGKLVARLVNEFKVFGATVGGGILRKLFGEADKPTNWFTRNLKDVLVGGAAYAGDFKNWMMGKMGLGPVTAENPVPGVGYAAGRVGPFLKGQAPWEKEEKLEQDKLSIRKLTELNKERRDLDFQMMNPAQQMEELKKRIRTTTSALKLSPEAFEHLGIGSKESLINQRLKDQVQMKQLAMSFEIPAVRDSLAAIGGGTQNTSAITPITALLDLIVKSTTETATNTKPPVGKPTRKFP